MLARSCRRLAAGARLSKGDETPDWKKKITRKGCSCEHKPGLQQHGVWGVWGEQREKGPEWLRAPRLRGPVWAGEGGRAGVLRRGNYPSGLTNSKKPTRDPEESIRKT